MSKNQFHNLRKDVQEYLQAEFGGQTIYIPMPHGQTGRPGRAPKTERNRQIVADRESGMEVPDIAAKYGIATRSVYDAIKSYERHAAKAEGGSQ